MAEGNNPAARPNDGYTVAAVLQNFDMKSQIGELRVLTSALPISPNFIFSLGYQVDRTGSYGATQAKDLGPYTLFAVAPILDKDYVGYLRQTGVITDQADTAELRRANFAEAIRLLRDLQEGRDPATECVFDVDEAIAHLRTASGVRHQPPLTIYQQATINRNALEEAEKILMVPGMIVDTPAWRRSMGAVVDIVRKQTPPDPDNGWIRYVHGETKLINDREYFALRPSIMDYEQDGHSHHIVRWDDDRSYGLRPDGEPGPGFVDTTSGSTDNDYDWYKEIGAPAPVDAPAKDLP
mgnify:CR=1 FL=1